MIQPGTQRRIMHRTTLHTSISFVSFSPDAFTSPLLISYEEAEKSILQQQKYITHQITTDHGKKLLTREVPI